MIEEGIIQQRNERYDIKRVDLLVGCGPEIEIDIPTTLTVLIKGIKSSMVEEGSGFDFERYNREIDGFGQRVQKWVEDNEYSDFIKLIEFEIPGIISSDNKMCLKIHFNEFKDFHEDDDEDPGYLKFVSKETNI